MKKVAIIGATGMLGSMMYNILKDNFSLVVTYKDVDKLKKLELYYGKTKNGTFVQFDLQEFAKNLQKSQDNFLNRIGDIDYIINCAGVVNRYSEENINQTIFINSVIPHMLSNMYGEKLIHITTDCVFNGIEGAPYSEKSIYSPVDWYGISKSIGEPSKQSLVLRTSIIGPEMGTNIFLFEWLKKQKKEVFGYTNHYWNGLTTKEFAKICSKIMQSTAKYPSRGLYHIFSTDVTKYDLLKKIKNKYNLPVTILPKEANRVDRRLRTTYSLKDSLQIEPLDAMLEEL